MTNIRIYLTVLVSLLISTSVSASKLLPVIHRVGVIPATWQGEDTYGIENLKEHLSDLSLELVNESKRFDVLNPDLVKSLWNTPEGRRELKTEFELDSFVHFTLLPKEDHLILMARLLDSDLDIQVQETETLTRIDAVGKSYDELKKLMRPLTYRLLTRLPIDVSITSVQGSYVTVSGGEDQALSVGDKLEIVRASVKSIHPAHGGWNHFDKVVVGSAVIIETKPNVSVAKITSQIKEGSIQIGDGATIEGLGTRRLFAKDTTIVEMKIDAEDKILIPPSYSKPKSHFPSEKVALGKDGKPIKVKKKSDGAPDKLSDGELTEEDAELVEVEPERLPENPAEQIQRIDPSAGDTSLSSDSGAEHPLFGGIGVRNVAESIDITPRYKSWTFTGPVTTSTDMVLPVNEVEVSMKKSLSRSIKYNIGALLGYGNTDVGSSFFSYGAIGSSYWMQRLPFKTPVFQRFKVGARAKYDGRSVSTGQYGGNDYATVGFFAGLEGEQRIGSTRFGFDTDFQMTPIAFGQIGYNGTQNSAKYTNGLEFNGSAITKKGRKVLNWGGGFSYGSQLIGNSNGQEVNISQFTVEALARWNF